MFPLIKGQGEIRGSRLSKLPSLIRSKWLQDIGICTLKPFLLNQSHPYEELDPKPPRVHKSNPGEKVTRFKLLQNNYRSSVIGFRLVEALLDAFEWPQTSYRAQVLPRYPNTPQNISTGFKTSQLAPGHTRPSSQSLTVKYVLVAKSVLMAKS